MRFYERIIKKKKRNFYVGFTVGRTNEKKKVCREETRMGYYPFSSPGRDTTGRVTTGKAWARSWARMAKGAVEQVRSQQGQHAFETARRARDMDSWPRGRDTKFCVAT